MRAVGRSGDMTRVEGTPPWKGLLHPPIPGFRLRIGVWASPQSQGAHEGHPCGDVRHRCPGLLGLGFFSHGPRQV